MEEKVIRRLNRLKRAGVIKDYAIGGAHAVAYYLEPIKTLDLDIFVFAESDRDFYIFRSYIKKAGFKMRGTHVIIDDTPVHFLPGSLHPFINEAVRKAKRISVRNIPSKVLTVEYLIVSLLMAFRLKDKMVIPDLLELADMEKLGIIIERFSDEETPVDKRLQRILGSI
jgi:DNA-binding Lrp family transcriptional regulator